MQEQQTLKCVIIGQNDVNVAEGASDIKLELLNTVQANYTRSATYITNGLNIGVHNDGAIKLQLWDLSAQERFVGMKGKYYKDAHIFVCAFSLASLGSMQYVFQEYENNIKQNYPNTPVIFVGTDLNSNVTFNNVELLYNHLLTNCSKNSVLYKLYNDNFDAPSVTGLLRDIAVEIVAIQEQKSNGYIEDVPVRRRPETTNTNKSMFSRFFSSSSVPQTVASAKVIVSSPEEHESLSKEIETCNNQTLHALSEKYADLSPNTQVLSTATTSAASSISPKLETETTTVTSTREPVITVQTPKQNLSSPRNVSPINNASLVTTTSATTTANIPELIQEMLKCSITLTIMTDPVIAADGFTYERGAITTWLLNHDTSPMSGNILSSRTLTVNQGVRTLLVNYGLPVASLSDNPVSCTVETANNDNGITNGNNNACR